MDDLFSTDDWNTEVKSVAEDIGFDVEQKEPRRLKLSGEDWFRVGDLFSSLSDINQQYTYCSISSGSLIVSCPPFEDLEHEFISEEYEFIIRQFIEACSETDMYEPFEYDIVDGVLELHTNVNQISDDSENSIVDRVFGGDLYDLELRMQTFGYSESDEYEFVYNFIVHANADLDRMQMDLIYQLKRVDKLWLDCPVCGTEGQVEFLAEYSGDEVFVCYDCWTPIPCVESIEERLEAFSDVSEIRSELNKLLQDGAEEDDDSCFHLPVPDESVIDYENVKLYDISNHQREPFLAVVDGFGFKYSLNSDTSFRFVESDGSGTCVRCDKENVNQKISAGLVGEWGILGIGMSVCEDCLDSLENDVGEAISNCHNEVSAHLI